MELSHSQHNAWEQEYQNPTFFTGSTEPIDTVKVFAKWLRRESFLDMAESFTRKREAGKLRILDLGCGIGRHGVYIAEEMNGGIVTGYDVSPTAIAEGKKLFPNATLEVRSIGDELPLEDASMDCILDITASHALYEGEREIYLRETSRILADDGIMLVRTLCKDGDSNAKKLIELSEGPEKDTYILENGMMERVFTERDFRELYERYFTIFKLEKHTGYQKWGDRNYKRRYIVAYMTKK